MSTVTAIKDILDAISSVKSRAKHSMAMGDLVEYSNRMGDLFALENCLVTETTKLMEEMEPVRLVA